MCLPNALKASLADTDGSSIYYGTSKCIFESDSNSYNLKIGNIKLNNPGTDVYKVFNGVLSSVVYSCYPNTTAGNTVTEQDASSGNILEAVQD